MTMAKAKKLAVGLGLALVGMAASNAIIAAMTPELDSVIAGDNLYYSWRGHDIFYKRRGLAGATPMLLLHGINAAASSYEMRKLVDCFSSDHEVYAPDLLGYGQSDRPAIEYTAEIYVQLLIDFAREVVGSGRGTVVVASSLTSAHLIEAAAREPQLFAHLVLIQPTGIEALVDQPAAINNLLYTLLRAPIFGQWLFNLLVSQSSLRNFLKRDGYMDAEQISDDLVDDYHIASHQPGARYAPASFLGARFNLNIRANFARLGQPLLVAWGRAARITPVWQAEAFADANPHARIHLFNHSNLLPHDEEAAEFERVVREWLTATV